MSRHLTFILNKQLIGEEQELQRDPWGEEDGKAECYLTLCICRELEPSLFLPLTNRDKS